MTMRGNITICTVICLVISAIVTAWIGALLSGSAWATERIVGNPFFGAVIVGGILLTNLRSVRLFRFLARISRLVDRNKLAAAIFLVALFYLLRVQLFLGDWVLYGVVASARPAFFIDSFWRTPLSTLLHVGSSVLLLDLGIASGTASRIPVIFAGAFWMILVNRLFRMLDPVRGWVGAAAVLSSGFSVLAFGHFEIYIYAMLGLTAVSIAALDDWRTGSVGWRSALLMGATLLLHPVALFFLPLYSLLALANGRSHGVIWALRASALQMAAGATPICLFIGGVLLQGAKLPTIGINQFDGSTPWMPVEMVLSTHRVGELLSLLFRTSLAALPVVLVAAVYMLRRNAAHYVALSATILPLGFYLCFAWNAATMEADWDMFVPAIFGILTASTAYLLTSTGKFGRTLLLCAALVQLPLTVGYVLSHREKDMYQRAIMMKYGVKY